MRTKLASDYKAYKVTEAATLVSAKGKTTYEAEVSKGGKSPDVLFNGNGSLTKKQAPVPVELHAGEAAYLPGGRPRPAGGRRRGNCRCGCRATASTAARGHRPRRR